MNAMTNRLLIALLSTGLALVGLSACGSDNPETSNQLNDDEGDLDEGDGHEEEDPRPGLEDIAAHLIVDVSPARYVYTLDTRITPEALAYNYNWEKLDDVSIQWTVTPEEAIEQDEGRNRWFLRQEGEITFQACADVPSAFSPVCASRTVIVAESGPAVTLESPRPGEHFHGDELALIPVEGVVSSPLEISRVQINGVDVEVDDNNRFSHQITPHFGVNTVTVRAFDGLHPVDGLAAASFLWAPDFHPVEFDADAGELLTTLDDAIIMNLGQNFFDDGEEPTYISESHILTQDLADIIYLVLQFLDLNSQLPDPVIDSDGFRLSVPDVRVEHPRVEIDVTDTGIQLYAQIQNLVAETDGFLALSDQTMSLAGEIVARLSIFAEVDVVKSSAEDPLEVELVHFQLAIEDASPDFVAPEANAIFELAESALRDNLESIILESVNLSFIDTLPDLLSDVFTSLEEAMAHQEFDLDLGFGDPLLLTFSGQIGQLLPIHRQGLEGFVQAQLSTTGTQKHPDNPGIARLGSGASLFPFFRASRIQIGLNLTLINGIFHNLWSTGLLDLDISDMIPDNFATLIQSARASGKLPPVAAPPIRDEAHDLMFHLGQFELDLEWNDRTDRFGAAISVGIDLTVADESIAIDISDEPMINLWLIESTANEPLIDSDGLKTLIRSQIWPELEAAIGEGLSFGLPVPEIGGLDDFAPELSGLSLDIRMTRPMEEREGFLMLDAAFEGELFLQ